MKSVHASTYLRRAATVALACVLLVLSAGIASAHKVNVFAYAEGGKIHADCYFNDGKKCVDSKVTVEDMSGRTLAEATTGDDGAAVFDIPAVEDLRIVLHASMGHKNDFVIKAEELASAGGAKSAAKAAPAGNAAPKDKAASKDSAPSKSGAGGKAAAPAAGTPTAPCDPEALRPMVEEAVEARVKPLYGMLAEMKAAGEKPRMSDVIGGIGYIIGLMGIVMYMKSRKAG